MCKRIKYSCLYFLITIGEMNDVGGTGGRLRVRPSPFCPLVSNAHRENFLLKLIIYSIYNKTFILIQSVVLLWKIRKQTSRVLSPLRLRPSPFCSPVPNTRTKNSLVKLIRCSIYNKIFISIQLVKLLQKIRKQTSRVLSPLRSRPSPFCSPVVNARAENSLSKLITCSIYDTIFAWIGPVVSSQKIRRHCARNENEDRRVEEHRGETKRGNKKPWSTRVAETRGCRLRRSIIDTGIYVNLVAAVLEGFRTPTFRWV